MQTFTEWLTEASFVRARDIDPEDYPETPQRIRQSGYRANEDVIMKVVALSIVKGMKSLQIARELEASGTPMDQRSVRRILARYGLTSQNREMLRKTAEEQIGTQSQSGSRYPWGNWQDEDDWQNEDSDKPLMPSSKPQPINQSAAHAFSKGSPPKLLPPDFDDIDDDYNMLRPNHNMLRPIKSVPLAPPDLDDD